MDETTSDKLERVVVSGLLCAGKTTFISKSERIPNLTFIPEPVAPKENSLLPKFYANQKKYAYVLQNYFLLARFLSYKAAMSHAQHKGFIMDRSIFEDVVFAKLQTRTGKKTSIPFYYLLLVCCLMTI